MTRRQLLFTAPALALVTPVLKGQIITPRKWQHTETSWRKEAADSLDMWPLIVLTMKGLRDDGTEWFVKETLPFKEYGWDEWDEVLRQTRLKLDAMLWVTKK